MLDQFSSQKFIRTGDYVIAKKDNQKRVVHYVVNHKGELSFDEPMFKIKELIVYCGNKIEHLLPTELTQN